MPNTSSLLKGNTNVGKYALGCLVSQIFDLDSLWIIKKLEMIKKDKFQRNEVS